MLGLYPIGAAPIGGLGRTSVTPAPPPLVYRARASLLAVVVPTRDKPSSGANASLFAAVVPMLNIPVPSLGAQVSQFAVVVPVREMKYTPPIIPYKLRANWLFPLLVQKGS